MHVQNKNLYSCDDGPLIVDVEQAVASIPAEILQQPPDSSRAPAASPEGVSSSTDLAPVSESPELAESSVVSASYHPNTCLTIH